MIRGAASVVLALLVLSGCGTRPTGHGAPPYEEPAVVKHTSIRTSYPNAHLRFTLPEMAGEDENAVRAYVRFNIETFRTWRSGQSAPGLRAVTTTDMRRLVINLLPVQHTYGRLDQPTLIEIRSISTQGALSSLRTCTHHLGKATSSGTLMVMSKSGHWRVSAIAPLHHPLKHCS